MIRGPRSWLLLCGVVALAPAGTGACSAWFPELLEERQVQTFDPPGTIALAPFYPAARLSQRAPDEGTEAWEAADLVGRFVSEALEARPVEVISGHDMLIAFEGRGQVIPRQAPDVLARVAHDDFGAQVILLGEVRRYREREGSAYGSFSPASVEFEVTLYSAPDASKLWVARFDQTQETLTGNLFTSARYPSGGTRFLTAAELARFGATLVAREIPIGR